MPDPTEQLIGSIKTFADSNGAKFLVGLQKADARFVRYLQGKQIPFVAFDGATAYQGAGVGGHWTPEGHQLVAERLFDLLSANSVRSLLRGARDPAR